MLRRLHAAPASFAASPTLAPSMRRQLVLAIALMLGAGVPDAAAVNIASDTWDLDFTIVEGSAVTLDYNATLASSDSGPNYFNVRHCLNSNPSICYNVSGSLWQTSNDHVTGGTLSLDGGNGVSDSTMLAANVLSAALSTSVLYADDGLYTATAALSYDYEYDYYRRQCTGSNGGPSSPYCTQYSITDTTYTPTGHRNRTGTVTVLNADPSIDALTGDLDVTVGETFGVSASASDAGIYDVLSYGWDLDGDGQYDDAFGELASWSFATVGTHVVGLEVMDDDGGSAQQSLFVTVVPEPTSALLLLAGLVGLAARGRRGLH